MAWAAKDSLASMRSRPSTLHPALLRAFRQAGTGPTPMMAGSTPACAQERMDAIGSSLRLFASFLRISITEEAPSAMPEEFPAVTVPLAEAGLSRDNIAV